MRNADFETITRSYTAEDWLKDKNEIRKIAFELLDQAEAQDQLLRLMGISASGLMDIEGNEEVSQLSLW